MLRVMPTAAQAELPGEQPTEELRSESAGVG